MKENDTQPVKLPKPVPVNTAWTRHGSGNCEWWSYGDWKARKLGRVWVLTAFGKEVVRHEYLSVVMERACQPETTPAAQSAGQEAVAWRVWNDADQDWQYGDTREDACRGEDGPEYETQPQPLYAAPVGDIRPTDGGKVPPRCDAAPVNGGKREVLGYVTKSAADYFVNRGSGHKYGEGLCIAYKRHNDTDMMVYVERAADAQQVGDLAAVRAAIAAYGQACYESRDHTVMDNLRDKLLGLFNRAALTSPAKVGGDEREAYRADMIAAGAKDLGNGTWEWDGGDFLFQLWRQARAALSADGGEDKRDAEYWRFLREQHEGTESLEDAEGFTVTEPTARAFTVFKPGQGDYHLEPVGCMPGELEETIRAAIAANQAKGDAS